MGDQWAANLRKHAGRLTSPRVPRSPAPQHRQRQPDGALDLDRSPQFVVWRTQKPASVSDAILAETIQMRRIQHYLRVLCAATAVLAALARARARLRQRATASFPAGRRRAPTGGAQQQQRVVEARRAVGLEAAAVGHARLKRLRDATRLQAKLERGAAPVPPPPGESPAEGVAAWWEGEQAVLRSGLPPSCDWDTLLTRTVTAVGGVGGGGGGVLAGAPPLSLHLCTAYLVSLPYAWNGELSLIHI